MSEDDIDIKNPMLKKGLALFLVLCIGIAIGYYYNNITSPYKAPEELPDYIDQLVEDFPPIYGNSGFGLQITISEIKANYGRYQHMANSVLVNYIRGICMAGDWSGVERQLPDMNESYAEACVEFCGCDING